MKAVLFDLDGTLTDPALGITNSILYALKSYGIENVARESLYSFIGPPLKDSFRERFGFSSEKSLEAVKRFQEYFSRRGIFENRVYEGIPSLLEGLQKQGLSLVLATSKPEEFALRILEHYGLKPYFSAVCGGSMDEITRTTKEEVIRYALESTGLLGKDCVMVGDRKYDIEGGRALGCATLGVLYGYGSREELEEAGADALAATVKECEEKLKQWKK